MGNSHEDYRHGKSEKLEGEAPKFSQEWASVPFSTLQQDFYNRDSR